MLFFAEGRGNGLLRVSGDYAELLLKGNELERIYSLDGSDGAAAFYLDTGLNYSYRLNESQLEAVNESINNANLQVGSLSFGLSYHFLQGAFIKYKAAGKFDTGFDEEGVVDFIGSDGAVAFYYPGIEEFADLARGHAFDSETGWKDGSN